MKVAFFVSSMGDFNLAKGVIQSLEKTGHEVLLVSLTKAIQSSVEKFESPAIVAKKSLPELLGLAPEVFPEGRCAAEQLEQIAQYIHPLSIDHIFVGVPSVSSQVPFQIAVQLDNIPTLMAYEFMFNPGRSHALWSYVPLLHKARWALPLATAKSDFEALGVNGELLHIIGHVSIDSAFMPKPAGFKSAEEIKANLQINFDQSFTFISSTTQPVEVDTRFLDEVLAELPKHPTMQIRLGLHPGITDLDAYISNIMAVYQTHFDANKPNFDLSAQFKIILPESLIARFKAPASTIDIPLFNSLFLRVNITGDEAAFAADRVAQAVPGALLNQGALRGIPAYSSNGNNSYLPAASFAETPIQAFFQQHNQRQPLTSRSSQQGTYTRFSGHWEGDCGGEHINFQLLNDETFFAITKVYDLETNAFDSEIGSVYNHSETSKDTYSNEQRSINWNKGKTKLDAMMVTTQISMHKKDNQKFSEERTQLTLSLSNDKLLVEGTSTAFGSFTYPESTSLFSCTLYRVPEQLDNN